MVYQESRRFQKSKLVVMEDCEEVRGPLEEVGRSGEVRVSRGAATEGH